MVLMFFFAKNVSMQITEVKDKKAAKEFLHLPIRLYKNEPNWMLEKRLNAYNVFESKKMPNWGGDLSKINFQDIHWYMPEVQKSQHHKLNRLLYPLNWIEQQIVRKHSQSQQ